MASVCGAATGVDAERPRGNHRDAAYAEPIATSTTGASQTQPDRDFRVCVSDICLPSQLGREMERHDTTAAE
jgi:hypothetical protein